MGGSRARRPAALSVAVAAAALVGLPAPVAADEESCEYHCDSTVFAWDISYRGDDQQVHCIFGHTALEGDCGFCHGPCRCKTKAEAEADYAGVMRTYLLYCAGAFVFGGFLSYRSWQARRRAGRVSDDGDDEEEQAEPPAAGGEAPQPVAQGTVVQATVVQATVVGAAGEGAQRGALGSDRPVVVVAQGGFGAALSRSHSRLDVATRSNPRRSACFMGVASVGIPCLVFVVLMTSFDESDVFADPERIFHNVRASIFILGSATYFLMLATFTALLMQQKGFGTFVADLRTNPLEPFLKVWSWLVLWVPLMAVSMAVWCLVHMLNPEGNYSVC